MAQGGTPKHDRKFVKLNIVISISRKKCQQKIFHSSYFFRIFWSRAFFSRRREDIKLGASLLLLVFFLRNFFVKSTCEFDKFQFFLRFFAQKKDAGNYMIAISSIDKLKYNPKIFHQKILNFHVFLAIWIVCRSGIRVSIVTCKKMKQNFIIFFLVF